jgi:hypothetical protein
MQAMDKLTTVQPFEHWLLVPVREKASRDTTTTLRFCLQERLKNNFTSRRLFLVAGLELRTPSMSSATMRGRFGSSPSLSARIMHEGQKMASDSLLPSSTLLKRFPVTDQLHCLSRLSSHV